MKKYLLLILSICLSAALLSGCGLTNLIYGVNIAEETTIYIETEERETFIYDEDEDLNGDDVVDDEKDEGDDQDGDAGDDKDSGETQEEKRYE